MIKKLRLKNFKCFSDAEFEFGNLTLLAGENGCGKSSLIHSLLLLKQSIEQGNRLGNLYLYGKYIDLGFAKEIINEDAEENELRIELTNSDGEHLEFAPKYEADKYILETEETEMKDISKINKFNLFSSTFEYLSAERITPQNIFSAISFEETLGKQGESTISFLEKRGLEIQVEPELWADDADQGYLLYQVNAWLDVLFNGFKLNISELSEADAVSLRYQEQGENHVSIPHRAINVGFGITYVLPVLVALLKAKKDDFIIIENPEAHLHPKAQRIMGEIILRAASVGAQIVLETHSDHILNGIRIGVRKGLIQNPDSVKVFFFMRENMEIGYRVKVVTPAIDEDGGFNDWPEGFFDEWEKALIELF